MATSSKSSAVHYFTFSNFEVIGGLDGGTGTSTGIGIRIGESGAGFETLHLLMTDVIMHHTRGWYGAANADNDNNVFRRLTIHHNGFPTTRPHGEAMHMTGHDNTLEDSDIYANEYFGVHWYDPFSYGISNAVIRNNRVHDTGAAGILVAYGAGNLVYNNLVYGNGAGYPGAPGITVGSGTSNRVLNNSIRGGLNDPICVYVADSGATDLETTFAGTPGGSRTAGAIPIRCYRTT